MSLIQMPIVRGSQAEIDVLKVLVIDDDDIFRHSLKFYLAANECLVNDFDSAESFLAADTHDYDCMIINSQLPGVTGMKLLLALRSFDVQTPAILITADEPPEVDLRDMPSGVELLTKPFESQDLLPLLWRLTGRQCG